jgi:probable phosphoglycerate mutase
LCRAFETARAIAEAPALRQCRHPLEVTRHIALRERHFGHFQGKTWAEIEAGWPEETKRWRGRDPLWAPDGGESLSALRERIARCVDEQQYVTERRTSNYVLL